MLVEMDVNLDLITIFDELGEGLVSSSDESLSSSPTGSSSSLSDVSSTFLDFSDFFLVSAFFCLSTFLLFPWCCVVACLRSVPAGFS